MRCTQIFGLSSEARKFIEENVKERDCNFCKHCGKPNGTEHDSKIYESAAHVGMFDDGPDLYEYQLKDGRVAREKVQDAPWSSGPCIFLCLEVDGERICEWPQEEIDHA